MGGEEEKRRESRSEEEGRREEREENERDTTLKQETESALQNLCWEHRQGSQCTGRDSLCRKLTMKLFCESTIC